MLPFKAKTVFNASHLAGNSCFLSSDVCHKKPKVALPKLFMFFIRQVLSYGGYAFFIYFLFLSYEERTRQLCHYYIY